MAQFLWECLIKQTVKKSPRWFWIAGLLGIIAVFILIPRPDAGTNSESFKLPPHQSFISIQGNRIATESFKGKVVILNFFTTWCPYCREEIQALNEIRKQYPEKEVIVLGLTVDNSESIFKIKNYIRSQKIDYPVFAPDPDIFLAFGFNGGGIPVTLIYNGTGKLQKHWVGYHSAEEMQQAIQSSK